MLQLRADGCLVSALGMRVLGYAIDARGQPIAGEIGDVCIPLEPLMASATSSVALAVNLYEGWAVPEQPYDFSRAHGGGAGGGFEVRLASTKLGELY